MAKPSDRADGQPTQMRNDGEILVDSPRKLAVSFQVMPHLRLEVCEEWAREDWVHKLLDHLVETVAAMRMESVAKPGEMVPLINKSNLKHAIVPLHYAHVSGDLNKRFLHVTLAAGNDTPGRTAEVRSKAAVKLGNEIDAFIAPLPIASSVASVTVWVQDIDRDRGYTTTAERKKAREAAKE